MIQRILGRFVTSITCLLWDESVISSISSISVHLVDSIQMIFLSFFLLKIWFVYILNSRRARWLSSGLASGDRGCQTLQNLQFLSQFIHSCFLPFKFDSKVANNLFTNWALKKLICSAQPKVVSRHSVSSEVKERPERTPDSAQHWKTRSSFNDRNQNLTWKRQMCAFQKFRFCFRESKFLCKFHKDIINIGIAAVKTTVNTKEKIFGIFL